MEVATPILDILRKEIPSNVNEYDIMTAFKLFSKFLIHICNMFVICLVSFAA